MPTNPALSNLSAALTAYTSETPTLEQEDPHAQTLVRAIRAVLLGVERGEVVGLPATVARDGVEALADRVAANYTAGDQHPEPAAAFVTEALASSYLRHQVQNATIDTDRVLRRVVAEAAGYLHDLTDHARLPDPRSRQAIDSAAQELRVLSARVHGLGDATVHAAYLTRHDAPAEG